MLFIILVVEILVLSFFFYMPLSASLKAEKVLNQGLIDKTLDYNALTGSTQSSGKPPSEPEKTVLSGAKNEDFLNFIDQTASSHNVRITQVSQENPVSGSEFITTGVNLTFEGEKKDIVAFLEKVEDNPTLFSYSTWQATPQDKKLKLSLRLTLYSVQ